MSGSVNHRGITTGTPVPQREREEASRGGGYLTIEHWTPEQIDAHLAKYDRKQKHAKSQLESPDDAQPREVVELVKNDEVTKEKYLELRLSGMNRTNAQRELGVNPATFYAFLRQWGIKDSVVEDRLLEAMREGQAVANGLRAEIAVSSAKSNELGTTSTAATSSARSNPAAASSDASVSQSADAPTDSEFTKKVSFAMTLTEKIILESINALIDETYDIAKSNGWHETAVSFPIQLALIHSEVSEALEADRKEHGPEKVAEELADIVIRTFDTAASHNIDLAGALLTKMHRNRSREYRHGGLKY